MQFMIIVKATAESEAGVMPTTEEMAAMGNFNEEMVKAGVLKDAAGIQPTSKGARIVFKGDQRSVVDGPFGESNLISGYWILEVANRQEAIDWMLRCPKPYRGDGNIEIRQVFGVEDFGDIATPEIRDQVERMHAKAGQ
jgi:hypothetical protein